MTGRVRWRICALLFRATTLNYIDRQVLGVLAFAAARFAPGLGEAGNFPAAVKAVAEWFLRRERAFAP